MSTYIFWGTIAFFVIALLIGFLIGLGRGIKRASTHILFAVASIIIAFFITKPITSAIMAVNINVDGSLISISDYIIKMVSENIIDLSNFDSASAFIQNLPMAIANPIIFMIVFLLVYLLLDIIYLVVARVSFGSKRNDFSSHKPHRLSGSVIGLIESFIFILVLFAPITSLTNTYEEIVLSSSSQSTEVNENSMPTINDLVSENIPAEVNEIIVAYNAGALGKVCSFLGFDDAMFDGLSSFSVDGEKITFRSELRSIADSYNSVASFYNKVSAGDYENLNFTSVKENLQTFMKNGLYKAVLVGTIKDLVVNFDEIKDSLQTEIPSYVEDIIRDIQAKFSTEDFDAYTYITNDLNSILETMEVVVNDGTFKEIMELDTQNLESILNFVTMKENTVSSALKSVVGLNLVSDALPTVLTMASEQLENMYQNEEGLVVGLNVNVTKTELTDMIDSIMNIVNEIKTLNDEENIFDILESEDMMDTIMNLKDIGGVLDSLGSVLDEANSLKIFNYETEINEDLVSVHAFENFVKIMGIDVLGEDVHVENGIDNLETYTEFFNYIKTPITKIVDSGLKDVLNSSADFDAILDILTEEIATDNEFLAKLLMPFYDLDKASISGQTLKAMVFDTVISNLETNLEGFVALSDGEDSYENWYAKLSSIGELLDVLNSGDIEGQTYLKYMLSENADQFTLISQMNTDGAITDLLNIVFGNIMYSPIYTDIFTELDNQVGDITGVIPTTKYENLADEKALYISTIIELLNTLNSDVLDSENMQDKLVVIGEILDILKVSADKNVFKDVFINLIWYLTGDVIDDNSIYLDETPCENAEDIKTYIGVVDKTTGYYEISFASILEEIADVLEFADKLNASIENINLSSTEDIPDFVNAIHSTIDTLYSNDHEKGVKVINNANKIVKDILTSEQIESYGTEISIAIETLFQEEYGEFVAPLKTLLGLGE